MGVKVARLVGDGVAVVVRPDVVRFVVAHGVKLLRSGRGCGGRCGVSAPDVLARLPARNEGERRKKRKERKGNKKGSGVPLPEP